MKPLKHFNSVTTATKFKYKIILHAKLTFPESRNTTAGRTFLPSLATGCDKIHHLYMYICT